MDEEHPPQKVRISENLATRADLRGRLSAQHQAGPNEPGALADLWLDIPNLDILVPILQIPLIDGKWDVSSLSNQVGYLSGTAWPTFTGNTAVAGRTRLSDGAPGPFCRLNELGLDEEINLLSPHLHYTYQVRLIRYVLPSHLFALRLRRQDWVTLVASNAHDGRVDAFARRFSLQAIRTRSEDLGGY